MLCLFTWKLSLNDYVDKFMVKNAIKVRYQVIKEGIKKFIPPIDLKGIGEIIIEDIDFENNKGILTVDVVTSGTISGEIRVVGEMILSDNKEKIILDVHDIEFVKLPFALKLTAGLLKQKIIGLLEAKATLSDKQVLDLINNGANNLLSDLKPQKGVDAQLNLKDLKFIYILTDNDGLEISTELFIEPRIEILRLPDQ